MRPKFSYENLLEMFAVVLIFILLFLIVTQVFGRYVFDKLPEWSSEEATLLFLMWLCATGSAIGSAKLSHLSVDALVKNFPVPIQRMLEIAVYVIVIIFLSVILYMTGLLAWKNRLTTTPRLSIPMILVQGSIPFAMGSMLYYNIKYLFLSFNRDKGREKC